MSALSKTFSTIGLGWLANFLLSSIGKKVLMSITGLFLVSFLIIHLLGNFQLLAQDNGKAFNIYAEFMTHNPVIKTVSYTLYLSILLHSIQGILLWLQNRKARGAQGYAVKVDRGAEGTSAKTASRMAWLGIIMFVFIILHMAQFWLPMKMSWTEVATYEGETVKDLYSPVMETFENPLFVAFYVLCMIVIAFHLWHGFQSGFQTLGLNHSKYMPLIRALGKIIAIFIPLGFAIIPIVVYARTMGLL
jgi:succinate dehydrogenase / fumarate reductase, cytochrome b subunit